MKNRKKRIKKHNEIKIKGRKKMIIKVRGL